MSSERGEEAGATRPIPRREERFRRTRRARTSGGRVAIALLLLGLYLLEREDVTGEQVVVSVVVATGLFLLWAVAAYLRARSDPADERISFWLSNATGIPLRPAPRFGGATTVYVGDWRGVPCVCEPPGSGGTSAAASGTVSLAVEPTLDLRFYCTRDVSAAEVGGNLFAADTETDLPGVRWQAGDRERARRLLAEREVAAAMATLVSLDGRFLLADDRAVLYWLDDPPGVDLVDALGRLSLAASAWSARGRPGAPGS